VYAPQAFQQAPAGLPSLQELTPPERIALDVEAADWREAVRVAGRLLVQSGVVTPNYIDAMLATAEELGQYIVVAPGIALPHARPEQGALATALSLVRLATPLDFGNPANDPVELVFGLAAVDKQVHVRAMQVLATLLLNDDLVRRLKIARSAEEVQVVFAQAEEAHNADS